MLEHFFQTGPIPPAAMLGNYDLRLVVLSYLVATFASYIALDLTSRLRDLNNTPFNTSLWLLGGAFAMGAGIWSMHYIGMLAYTMSSPMIYDPLWTAFSMAVAVAASGFALYILKIKKIHYGHILMGGIVLGLAIAAMHYTGMQAMTVHMDIHYLPSLFFLSIIIAIIASQAALWLAIKSSEAIMALRFRLKFISAFIMGAAICGMHYTGMEAAVFTPHAHMPAMNTATLSPDVMAISIAAAALIILGIAFLASTYKEALNQQSLLKARQQGKAEVASSVLHNVGNVLNSIAVSSLLIGEKLDESKLSELVNLSKLMDENKQNLEAFIKNDPRGLALPDFLNSLAKYWLQEKENLLNETQSLNKNIEHIKKIIAAQQDFSKTVNIVEIESIKNILEEALLISGLPDEKVGITLQQEVTHLKPALIDKVKLLQVLVNLLGNAKEALSEATSTKKVVTVKASHIGNQFSIQISDTGIGISPGSLARIFSYGYTTKKEGHGYGLHSAAISVKEMGGSINASSEGMGKGSTFTANFPYNSP